MKGKHSSKYLCCVLKEFLNCYNDSQIYIRELFLQTSIVLLSCSKRFIDSSINIDIRHKVMLLCVKDYHIDNRKFALNIIAKIIHYRPKIILNDVIMDKIISLCFDSNSKFRLFAQEKLVEMYIDFSMHYSSEKFYLPKIGQLAGALKVRYTKFKLDNKEKIHLEQLLEKIQEFLICKYKNNLFKK